MKKTSDLAPSKTDSSFGQPPVTTTGSTPGTCDRHLASSLVPALNSWSPGPWLGLPAIRTIWASSARAPAATEAARARPIAIQPNRLVILGCLAKMGGGAMRGRHESPARETRGAGCHPDRL